jgi:hypothetical protein
MSVDNREVSSRHGAKELVFIGLSHPADRAVFAFFRKILAAGEPPVGARLITDPSTASGAGVQIRSEALEVLRLAGSGHVPGGAGKRARYAEAVRLGAPRPDLAMLSVERVLCDPLAALRQLGQSAGLSFTPTQLDAARRAFAELQEQAGRYLHPISYLDAFGTGSEPAFVLPQASTGLSIDIAFLNDLEPGAPVLLLGAAEDEARGYFGGKLDDLDVIVLPLLPGRSSGPAEGRSAKTLARPPDAWPDMTPFQPQLIHFTGLSEYTDLPVVLDWALAQSPATGRLAGREPAAPAMYQLLAGLTRHGGGEIDFLLDGACWAALPPACRSA